jgi:hypothetical protein
VISFLVCTLLYFKLPDIVHSKIKSFFNFDGIDYASDVISVATVSSKTLKVVMCKQLHRAASQMPKSLH